MYNLLTCGGFGAGKGWIASGSCIGARLTLVILFFAIAIVRKWGAEEWGFEFSLLIAAPIGLLAYFIVITIFGNLGTSFLIGLLAGTVGGYVGGYFFGGGDDGE